MSDYISQDLLFLIFQRLQVKPLLRIRCVCKSWKQVIDSKPFIVDHLSGQKPRILLENADSDFRILDPHNLPKTDELRYPDFIQINDALSKLPPITTEFGENIISSVVGAVHGVICLLDNEYGIFLWNPSIRRLLAIPAHEFLFNTEEFLRCGFWIDPCSNEFKVAIFCLERNELALFSSVKQSWTKLSMNPFTMTGFYTGISNPQILIRGIGHWMAYDRKFNEIGVVFTFDFVNDKFRSFKIPELEGLEYVNAYTRLLRWKGLVSIAHWQDFNDYFDCRCDIWAMRNGYWSKMLSFTILQNIGDVLHVMEDSGRVLSVFYGFRIGLYDPKCRRFILLRPQFLDNAFGIVYDFVESLVFPDEKCISV